MMCCQLARQFGWDFCHLQHQSVLVRICLSRKVSVIAPLAENAAWPTVYFILAIPKRSAVHS